MKKEIRELLKWRKGRGRTMTARVLTVGEMVRHLSYWHEIKTTADEVQPLLDELVRHGAIRVSIYGGYETTDPDPDLEKIYGKA